MEQYEIENVEAQNMNPEDILIQFEELEEEYMDFEEFISGENHFE